ncbi:MAG: immunoglobulin domain-containing protein, partial [Verrucomicrobia bacterium]|nr:immunoglobulin domain-containing protein [Verrucomicrobiota bacterium]
MNTTIANENAMDATELPRTFIRRLNGTRDLLNPMKGIFLAHCLCGLASGVFGQGLVQLTNDFSTLVRLDVPGMPAWPPPGSLLFGLVTSPAWATDYRPTLILATNLAVQGLVSGGVTAVPGWPVGETRTFTIVGWSASLGTNFNPAWLRSQRCLAGVGVSQTGSGSPGGIDPVTGRTIPPLNPFQAIHSGLVLYGPLSPEFCPTVAPPPSQYALIGSTVVFNAFAQSGPQPLTYQWQFNGTNLSGATNSTLVLTNVNTSVAGAYSVNVGNPWAMISSGLAMLVVGGPPTISRPPQSQTANAGSTVDFTVIADGTPPLTYNWFLNGNNLLSGSTGPVLELTNVQFGDAGAYSVVVDTVFGAVASSPALLTVVPSPPTIVQPPRDHKANVGWSLDFTVTARGSIPLSYQWFFNDNAIPGASDDDLHLTDVQSFQSGPYTVIVTNTFGAVTSTPAMLSVIPAPTNLPSGTVVAWGDLAMPYVAPGTRFAAIAAGSLHNLAIKADGTVVAWGNDSFGQATVPAELSGVVGVAAGMQFSLALKSDGTVVAWGDSTWGQTLVPAGLGSVVGIAAGRDHSLSLKSDGTVVSWGADYGGETNMPASLRGIIAVAAGTAHNLALKSDGTVVAWGGPNLSGEISVPQGLNGVTAIAAKGNHSLALKSDGTVVPWGENYSGEANVPADLKDVVAIAAGDDHNLVLQEDGKVVAWGNNQFGQCIVPGTLGGVIALASGGWYPGQHLALKADGTVVAWGWIAYQPTSWMPANLSGVSALAAGKWHGLALKPDGTVVLWGDGSYGQTNPPAGLSNVLAIAAGGYHSLAVESDGTVIAWGNNS